MKIKILNPLFLIFLFLTGGPVAQTGATPPSEIALQATSHDYGSAALGEAAEWILAVSNLSTVDLIVSHITSEHADFSAIPATFTVAPGGTREVTVTFAPSSLGSISGSLTIASNDPDESLVHIFLSGEGVQPDATLRVRRGSGTPGSSNNIVAIDLDNNVAVYGVEFNLSYDPDILTVTNVEKTARSAGLRFGMWQESTPGTVYVAYLDIENSIGPGSGPIFNFSFDVEADAPFGNVPLRLLGVSTMDLDTLLNTASVDSFFTVWAPGAAIDVSDMSHDFGVVNVGSSSDWTLTVFNVGLSDLVVSNISSSRTDFSVDITSFNIGSGDSRDVRVAFRPLSGGAILGQLTIFSNDADRPTVTISLSGQGCSRPEIAVNPPSWDYGDVGVGSFADKSFVVSNDGCQNLEVTGTSLVGTDADQFAIVGGGGAFTVNQGGAHIIVVRFSPTSAGTKNATLRIMSNDPDEGTKDVPLSGGICVPPEPDIAVDPAFWDYGPVAIGGTEDKTFAVSNVGCQDLVVTATTVVGADAGLFTIISGGGPFTLNRGGSHDIILRFEPLTEGDKSATLQIASNDPDEPTKDVSLIGEGCGPPNISVDPASWDFGLVDVTGSSDITIVVSNTGCQDLEVTGTNIVGANPDQFSIVSGGGSFTVVRGATHNIVVRFAPTSGGTKNGGLQILSTDPDEGGLIVPLTGQGCSLQDIAVDPASWDYGVVDLGGYEEKSFVVSNDGCQDLAVTGTSLVGADPDQFSIVSGGGAFTIPQGGSHDVVVRFAPTSTGNKSAALRITSNDPDEPTVDVEVTGGVCVFPDIVVDPETWDYGSVDVGADVDKEIIISNDGCQDLEVTGTGLVGADSEQFSIVSGGAPFSVAQGETHGVTVRFSPSSPGTKNAGLRINSNDPDQGVVTIPLNGLGCGDPDIAMDPASWDYGEIDVGSSADVNIAVSNVGCQVLQVAATNLTGANPDQFSIVSGEGPFSVVQGGTHNLVVRFSPTSGGNKSGRLQILSNDPDEGTVNVALTGEGCVVADISIDPLFWDYGTIDVGDYGEKTIVVTNTGCQVLQVTATTVVGADPTEFSIVSGGGFFTVAGGSSHDILVRFTPTSGGPKNAALQILSNDPDEGTEEVPLTGDGCAYPDIAVDPSLWDFNLVDVGDFEEILIVVSNLGCQMLEVTATSIVGGDPDQFVIVSGGGPFTIAQGQTHDMLVRFRPTSGGSKSAVLQIVSNDPDENIKNVSLNGEGCSYQDVSINPTSWNYGTVDIGSFQDKTFVLSNLGCQILQVTGVELVGPDTDQFSIVDGHGAFTLVQGERRNMVVRFGPTSGGSKTVTLQITSNDPDEATLQVQLSGGVCLEPDIGVNPTSWDFSTVNVSQHTDKPIVVSNTGCQLLEVSATNIVGPDAGSFSVLSGGGAFTVVQGETDSVVVRFAPTSGGGKSATLQIVSNDPDEGTKDISLSGTGCSQPDIALDPPSWNYDQVAVGDHADRIFVVANEGCQDLVVSGTAVVGSDAAQFAIVSGGGPFTVVQGGAHSVVVRFSPTDGGAKTASFQVHSNDPDEEEYSVPLTGSAVAPDIALSDTSHDFDGAPIGQPQYWILEISNVGDGDLTVTSISSDRADFAVSYPTFPQTVLPGEFISVAVVFIPSVTGLITGSLTIASNDLDEPTLSVSLRGLGLVPDIELSETSHNFGGVVVGNATEWILTVTNMGTGDLVVRTIGSDNPVFAVDITSFTVEPGGSQLVTVTFGPTAAGLTSGLLTIFSSDPDEPVLSVVLTGEGLVPDIEVVTSHNFGDVPVGNFAQWTMTVSNVGTGTLVVSGVGSDNPDFTVAPTSFTVVPGGSRDVVVTFTPSQGEAISGQITVVSNDPDEPMVTVYVMGNGLVPDINIPVASYDFGGVLWGDSATWNLDVQNVGPGELFVTDIASDNPDFGVDLITFTLIPGASQSVGITFVPSTGGPIFGQLVVSSNDPDEPTVTVGLTGTGLVPDIDISATSHTFENVPVGQSSDWILTVFNVGTGDLEVKDVVSNSSDFRVDITAFSVVPNLSRDVTVTFTPSTEGLISGQLTIYSNDPDEPTVGVMVSGAGLVPDIEIPTSFDFGEVGTDSSAEWTLLIENVGGADLIVNDVRSDNAAFTVTSPPLPLTIGPGSSQSVPVTFAPSDSEIYNGKLTITSNDPDEPKLYISLTGIGIPPVSVQLNSFVALAHEGVVLLRWTVGAAKGCMGFHVYRSSSMDGVYERLTRSLIPVVSGAHTYRDGSTSGQGFYYYRLGAVDLTGREEYVGVASVKVAGLVPGDFGLAHNYPNPFNPETRIAYTLPEGGRVTLAVYNTLGQKVKRLVDGSQSSGRYAVLWDGRDDLGQDVPSGIYIAVLRSGTFTDRKKMVLLK